MADLKITQLPTATTPAGTELAEIVQGGVNKKVTLQEIADLAPEAGIQSIVAGTNVTVDDTDPLNPIVSASGGGGTGTVESVTGDGVDNTDPDNPVLSFPDAGDVAFTPSGDLSATTVQAALEELDAEKVSSADIANKVDKETFATLTYATPIAWDTNSRQSPLAKVTMTGSAAINMTNVKDGSQGVLKITSGTASQFTLTFDTDFTNVEATTGQTMLTYTFPDVNGAVYILSYVVDGTTISWMVLDTQAAVINPMARVTRVTAQSISNNDLTVAVSFTAETYDNNSIWAVSPNPTRLVIPGSGNKVAHVNIRSQWASNATGLRRNIPYLNGVTTSDIGQQVPATGVATILNTSHQVICAGGDYIEVVCYQNSGGALSLDVCVVQITVFDI